MGKKKQRAKYISKGQRKANNELSKAVKRDRHPLDIELFKLDAKAKGKRVYFTVPNPDTTQTNKRWIRQLWTPPKKSKVAA